MKLKDFVSVYTNKKNYQTKFELKKRILKKNNINMKDIMDINIPISKKLKEFEEK